MRSQFARILPICPGVLLLSACSGSSTSDPGGSLGGIGGGATSAVVLTRGGTTAAGSAQSSGDNSGGNVATANGGASAAGNVLSRGGNGSGVGGAASTLGSIVQAGGIPATRSGSAIGGANSNDGSGPFGGATNSSTSATNNGGSSGKASNASSQGRGGTKAAGGNSGNGGTGNGGQGGSGAAPGATTSRAGSAAGGGTSTGALIQNDEFWRDASGEYVYSQGGGVLKVGDTYYWYGVKYSGAVTYAKSPTNENSASSFEGVTIYSSTDLAKWKFEGYALTKASVPQSSEWIGRVGAAYNPTTKKFVLNGQYLGTPDTTQFFATSDTPNGAFQWDHTQAVITNVVNNNCGDQSVFTDDDGKAYVLCSSLSGRSNTYIAPLRPADFLEVQAATRVFGGAGREGNAMFKYDGRYYVCSSDLHGWNASHTYCISSTNIMGPYDAEQVMGNTDLDFSHVTQTGLFVTVKGATEELVIFGGDRWSDFAGNGLGYNQWMPLTFDGTRPVMQSLSEWTIDATNGTWSVGPGNNYVLNPTFEADRVATNPPAGWTTTSGSDVTDTHTGNFAWKLSDASSIEQKIPTLPNGTYTLSAWAKGSGASGTIYAKGFGGSDKSVSLGTASASWSKLSVTGIAVANGTCTVGAASSSGTVTVDDFILVRE